MKHIMNDIQLHGVTTNSNFTLGWMCLIYKKKDQTLIKNYHPITLLNTDYKILMKALALQLAKEIHTLIHPNQSGFIPKRSIFNPIRLAQTMTAYADLMEENGAIIALDQEKVYDRIKHDYLFDTLNTFQLPQLFTNAIKTLYKSAFTQVAINGFLSTPFKVTRGVHQGDPLSCLLFNLAIEPLTCTLCNSQKIKGYNIPRLQERIIVNMYTDDTTIYLSQEDKYTNLEDILQCWCLASGAKFNLEKTKILPIGLIAHQARVLRTCKINVQDTPWHKQIRIASDGNPIRTLGAWVGNNIKNATSWEPVLRKIEKKPHTMEYRPPYLRRQKTDHTNDRRRNDTIPNESARDAKTDSSHYDEANQELHMGWKKDRTYKPNETRTSHI